MRRFLASPDAGRRRSVPAPWLVLTGASGVGKSVLAGALAAGWEREGRSVGVVAVDPTSPRSGGALLGDRIRMGGASERVFVRSMAARGAGSGLAPEVAGVVRLMALAGMDRVVVETAGTGQSDVEALGLGGVAAAVTAPGLGDDVQAAKAGLFELAPLVIVNKADRMGAEATAATFRAERSADPESVVLVSARTGEGVAELAARIDGMAAASSDSVDSADSLPKAPPFGDPGLRVARLHHVGIATSDAAAAAAKWAALLGLVETGRHEAPEFGVGVRFLTPRGRSQEEGGNLELLEPRGEDTPVGRFLSRRGEGMHHVCFDVEDLDAALALLRERGVRLVDERPRRGAGGHLVAFVHPKEAGGVLLELRQA